MWKDPTFSGLFPRAGSLPWEGRGAQGVCLTAGRSANASLARTSTSLAQAGYSLPDATARLASAGNSLPRWRRCQRRELPGVSTPQPGSANRQPGASKAQPGAASRQPGTGPVCCNLHVAGSPAAPFLPHEQCCPQPRAPAALWRTQSTAMASETSTASVLISLGSFASASPQAPSPHCAFPLLRHKPPAPTAPSPLLRHKPPAPTAPSPLLRHKPPAPTTSRLCSVTTPHLLPALRRTPRGGSRQYFFGPKAGRVRFQSALSVVLGASGPPSESESPLRHPTHWTSWRGRSLRARCQAPAVRLPPGGGGGGGYE